MILAALLLAAAANPVTQEQAFNPPALCRREELRGGLRLTVYLGDRSCIRFQPARRFAGLWINAFEGQEYIDAVRTLPSRRPGTAAVWLSTDDRTEHRETTRCPRQHVCRIVFDGRAAVDMHRAPLDGYGHMGMSSGLVLADRILTIADLGPLGATG